jgi:hypothetical protein
LGFNISFGTKHNLNRKSVQFAVLFIINHVTSVSTISLLIIHNGLQWTGPIVVFLLYKPVASEAVGY